ncbi:MAG: DUF4358 domain-containing protein [Oscillospiraceae bacterium]|nr:DUF4358 domain-containing protein [Oscillospiraceae bacterium]
MTKNLRLLLSVLLFSCFFVTIMLSGCTSDSDFEPTATLSEITGAIVESEGGDFPTMLEKTRDDLENRYFGIKDEWVEDASFRINPAGANPDEITIVKTTSSEAATELRRFFADYVSGKKEEWKDYQPGEMHKFDNVVIESRGLYTVLFICSDSANAREILDSYFK